MSLNPNRVRALFGVLATMMACGLPTPAAAQGTPQRTIRIALPDSFPADNALALVLRSGAAPTAPTVILNRAHLDENTVSAAMVTAYLSFRRPTLRPTETEVVSVATTRPRKMSKTERETMSRYLRLVQAQQASRIGNLGQGRWIEVPAPANQARVD